MKMYQVTGYHQHGYVAENNVLANSADGAIAKVKGKLKNMASPRVIQKFRAIVEWECDDNGIPFGEFHQKMTVHQMNSMGLPTSFCKTLRGKSESW
jgi:hypothetical protein